MNNYQTANLPHANQNNRQKQPFSHQRFRILYNRPIAHQAPGEKFSPLHPANGLVQPLLQA